MKKLLPILLLLVLVFIPTASRAQCNGVFPAKTLCGNLSGVPAIPGPFSSSGGVFGPASSTAGDFAVWDNATGTLLADAPISLFYKSMFFPIPGGTTAAGGRDFYINSTIGLDTYDCLAATVGGGHGPCLTVQHGIDVALAAAVGGTVIANNTLHVTGTFTAGGIVSGPATQGFGLAIQGTGAGTDSIDDTSGVCFTLLAWGSGTNLLIQNLTLSKTAGCPGGGSAIFGQSNSYIQIADNAGPVTLGVTTGAQMQIEDSTVVEIHGSYKISGNAPWHLHADNSSEFLFDGVTVTCSGVTAYSQAFISLNGGSTMIGPTTYSGCGAVTGDRLDIESNSVFDPSGTSFASIPGNGKYLYTSGGQILGAPLPTLGTCTNGTVASGSTDDSIRVEFTGNNTSCDVKFAFLKAEIPICVGSNTLGLSMVVSANADLTGVTIAATTLTNGSVATIMCTGRPF